MDEFQNFATDSFATILSEARKYGLNLTVANQYISQMSMEVRDAVFGNVGSIISFRTSADDARVMLKYFEPAFLDGDFVHMHNRDFVVSMTIEGDKVQAFSATTLGLPEYGQDYSAEIVAESRARYAVVRGHIETFMHARYGNDHQQPKVYPQSSGPKPKVAPKTIKKPADIPKAEATPTPSLQQMRAADPKKVAKDILKLTSTKVAEALAKPDEANLATSHSPLDPVRPTRKLDKNRPQENYRTNRSSKARPTSVSAEAEPGR